MSNQIKIATLIISSNTYPAKRNSNAQKKIFFREGFDKNLTFWYRGGTPSELNNEKFKVHHNDLLIDTDDSTINMGLKTIMAFEWLENNVDYDFVVRPTPSSYINYKNLYRFISNNLTDNQYIYCGKVQSTNDKSGKKIDFVSGSTLILNKKSIKAIIDNKHRWDHRYWDDVALSLLMKDLNIEHQNSTRFDIKGNPFKSNYTLGFYQYRCRCDNHYGYPRYLESTSMRILHKILFQKNISNTEKILKNIYYEVSKFFYVYQFGWKMYSLMRLFIKKLLPRKFYNFLKRKFKRNIDNFKHVRFKV